MITVEEYFMYTGNYIKFTHQPIMPRRLLFRSDT